MIFLYVFLGFALLLLFLLYLNVHLIFVYREKATVTLRILFFRTDAVKLVQKYLEKKKNVQPKMVEKSKSTKAPSGGVDLLGFAEFLAHIATVIRLAIKEHLEKMRIDLKELNVTVATQDAAQTALLYGGAIQGANALCALLCHFSNFKCNNKKLVIAPDFASDKSEFSIHLVLTSKPIHLIGVFLRSYFRFFEGKDNQNARNSVKTSH